MEKDKHGNEYRTYDTYYGCPWKTITEFTSLCATWYGHYKNGFLLREGGIEAQSAVYLEAMRIMDSEFNKINNEKMEEQTKK